MSFRFSFILFSCCCDVVSFSHVFFWFSGSLSMFHVFLFSFPGSSGVRACSGAWVPANCLLTMRNVLILLQFASVSVKSSWASVKFRGSDAGLLRIWLDRRGFRSAYAQRLAAPCCSLKNTSRTTATTTAVTWLFLDLFLDDDKYCSILQLWYERSIFCLGCCCSFCWYHAIMILVFFLRRILVLVLVVLVILAVAILLFLVVAGCFSCCWSCFFLLLLLSSSTMEPFLLRQKTSQN